jgi:hypothetical protein
LQLRVEACLSRDFSKCAPPAYLTLRDWADFSLGLELGGTFVPISSASSDQTITDITAIGVSMPTLQFNVFDTVRNFRPYRVSIYGTVPVVAMGRGIYFGAGPGGPNFERLDQRVGVADFAVGASAYIAGNAHFDVSYNARSGKVNLVDSVRNLSSPRLLNLGDGFESIDTSLQLRQRFGQTRWFGSVYGGLSHAFRRTFSDGDWAERGEFAQVTGGVGRDIGTRGAGVMFWGGRSRYGELRTQNGGVSGISRTDWLAGVTASGASRRHTNLGGGFIVGGLGGEQIYVSASLRLVFNLF